MEKSNLQFIYENHFSIESHSSLKITACIYPCLSSFVFVTFFLFSITIWTWCFHIRPRPILFCSNFLNIIFILMRRCCKRSTISADIPNFRKRFFTRDEWEHFVSSFQILWKNKERRNYYISFCWIYSIYSACWSNECT